MSVICFDAKSKRRYLFIILIHSGFFHTFLLSVNPFHFSNLEDISGNEVSHEAKNSRIRKRFRGINIKAVFAQVHLVNFDACMD